MNENSLRKLAVKCFLKANNSGNIFSTARNPSHAFAAHRTAIPHIAGLCVGDILSKTSLKLVTWNVDFMAANHRTRLSTILRHIQSDVFRCNADSEQPEPCCILLQEIHSQAFPEILENEWLRQHFCVTPVGPADWSSGRYGNVTLASRTVPVLNAQVLHFGNSQMGRHALVVDLEMDALVSSPGTSSTSGEEYKEKSPTKSAITVRVANVHLESLPVGTSLRPGQLSATANMLREDGIHVGVAAGDMNAITPGDGLIPQKAGLLDAWTGDEGDKESFTWGHQPPSRYPARRLDKVLCTSKGQCAIAKPDRVGVGLRTVEGQWASDHYGLATILEDVYVSCT